MPSGRSGAIAVVTSIDRPVARCDNRTHSHGTTIGPWIPGSGNEAASASIAGESRYQVCVVASPGRGARYVIRAFE